MDDSFTDSESSCNRKSNLDSMTPTKKTKIVLVKGIAKGASPDDLKTALGKWGKVSRLVKKPFTNHYYLEFETMEAADQLASHLTSSPVSMGDKPLNVMRINKVPLDLNFPSKVLLVTFIGCTKEMTVERVMEIFGTYGNIGKVVIYKKKNVQILVEMDSMESAVKIRDDQEKISKQQDFKMKIQFTNKKNLIVEKNCHTEYDSKKGRTSIASNDHSKKSKEPETLSKQLKEKQFDISVAERNSMGSFSKYSSQNRYSPIEEKGLRRESDITYMQKKPRMEADIGRQYGSLGRITGQYNSRLSTSAGSENKDEESALESKLLIQEVSEELSHDMLFNLCSLYGNINEIWIHSDLRLALVSYECNSQVHQACGSLNGLIICDSQLKAKRASDEAALSDMVMDGEDVDYRQNPNQRFKIPGSKNHNNVNPPSTTIHLSNLPENYDLNKLHEIFFPIAKAQNISYFSGSKTMALANFDSVSEASQVLASYHNFNILGRFIKIAFARYKLRMTPKIIAHNEELQRLERGVGDSSREFKQSVEGKATIDSKIERLSKVSRGSQPYSPDFFPEKQTYYSPFQESPYKDYELHKPTPPTGDEEDGNEEIVHKMLDYLDI